MRLFIGIPLSSAVTASLLSMRASLEGSDDGLRWSSPESWHITLQFLGAASESQYFCVVEHLKTLRQPPFPVQLKGTGIFERVGVFFAGVNITPELHALQRCVTAATSICGFVPEFRAYHPHITLARRKGQSGGIRALQARMESLQFSAPAWDTFPANEFLLYESFPAPSGSRYQVLARFPLT